MSKYKKQFTRWHADLNPLQREVINQMTLTQDEEIGLWRNNPTRLRQLNRLIDKIKEDNLSNDDWSNILDLIIELPDDDFVFIAVEVIGNHYSSDDISNAISCANAVTRQRFLDMVQHLERIREISETFSQETMIRLATSGVKHQQNKKKS